MFVSIILFLCIGICTITDILRKTVDIRVLLAFSSILAVCCYFEKNYNIESFVAGIGIGIMMAGISILSRGAVGMGDVCLYSIIICFIGVQKGIFVIFLLREKRRTMRCLLFRLCWLRIYLVCLKI